MMSARSSWSRIQLTLVERPSVAVCRAAAAESCRAWLSHLAVALGRPRSDRSTNAHSGCQETRSCACGQARPERTHTFCGAATARKLCLTVVLKSCNHIIVHIVTSQR